MKINTLVSMCLDRLDMGENEFARCYRLAVAFIGQMKWDFTGTIDEQEFKVLPNKTIPLPLGFLKERFIGVYNDATGELQSLSENRNLSLRVECKDRSIKDGDEDCDMHLYDSGSSRNIGEYRIDRTRKRIVFDPQFPHQYVTIEFNTAANECGEIEVNEMVSEAIITHVEWKMIMRKKGAGRADKLDAERIFYNELRKAKLRVSNPTKAAKNRNSRMAVKWGVKG